jgi:predicted ferric reductase
MEQSADLLPCDFSSLRSETHMAEVWNSSTLILAALQIIFNAVGEPAIAFAEVSRTSNHIFVLVLGIVHPLMFLEPFVAQGITRKRFAQGLLAAAAILSVCFVAVQIAVSLATNSFSAKDITYFAVSLLLGYLTGCTAVIGFQFRRVFPAIIGIVCSSILLHGEIYLASHSEYWNWAIIVLAVVTVCLAFAIPRVVRRVPIKC